MNLADRRVSPAGKEVPLTVTEARIVQLLALRRGRAVSKEAMISCLSARDDAPATKTIDVFVCKICRKIADLGGTGNHGATVWGRGHQLLEPASPRKAA